MESCNSGDATDLNRFRRLFTSCCCSSCTTAEVEAGAGESRSSSVSPVDALSEEEPPAVDRSMRILTEDRPHDAPSPLERPIEILQGSNITVGPQGDGPSRPHVESPGSPMIEDAPSLEDVAHVPEIFPAEPPASLRGESPRVDRPPSPAPVSNASPEDARVSTPGSDRVSERLQTEPPAPLREEIPGMNWPPSPPPASNASPGDVQAPTPDPDHIPERLPTETPAPPRGQRPRHGLPPAPPPDQNALSVDVRSPTGGPPKFGLTRALAILCLSILGRLVFITWARLEANINVTGDEPFTTKVERAAVSGTAMDAQNHSATSEGGAAASEGDACWVFMHMGQSGSEIAKQIAVERWWKDGSRLFDTVQWRRGDHSHQADAMGSQWQLLHGGCVESLRGDSSARACKWITVFRHPVGRLLAAYDHCRWHAPKDPVCPPRTMGRTDLTTFAEWWGNFAMRQFAMAAVPPPDVKEWAARNRVPRDASLWYLVREYLTRGGVITEDDALRDLLQPIRELLSAHYAAVGIAAEPRTTMRLFDEALPMEEGLGWLSSWSKLRAKDGEEGYDWTGSAAFRGVLANPRIMSALRLDILLYEHAEGVFQDQVERYGVR